MSFQQVVHWARAEEAEVAKLQISKESRVDVHKNARLTPKGRGEMVRRVLRGEPPSAVAAAFGTTAKTVKKWVGRDGKDSLLASVTYRALGALLQVPQRSSCSEMLRASSTSMPRYRTVLSSFLWPSRSWTALRLPVLR